MTDWNDIFDFEWNIGDHARPNVARLTFDYTNDSESQRRRRIELERDIGLELEHPHKDDLYVGEMSAPAESLPEWLIEEERPLFVRADASGEIRALYYGYETRYDTPEYGFFELDPEADGWASLPAGTYSVVEADGVGLLWYWGDEPTVDSAPPAGATDVMTREQPNDADVPLYVVPEPLIPGDGTVIASPAGAPERVAIDQFEHRGSIGELDAYQQARREHVEGILGETDREEIVFDAEDTTWEPADYEGVVVADVYPDEDRVLAMVGQFLADGVINFEFDGDLFNIAASEEGLDAAPRWTTNALIRGDADVSGFSRGDVYAVDRDDGDSPDVEALQGESVTTFALRPSPHMSAGFKHAVPDFGTFPMDPHPDNYVPDVPDEHGVRYTTQEDEPRGYTCSYAAGPPETRALYEHTYAVHGYALYCERPELPGGIGNRPTVRYANPDDAYGTEPRVTRIWPDEGDLREYDRDILAVTAENEPVVPNRAAEEAGLTTEDSKYSVQRAVSRLSNVGYIEVAEGEAEDTVLDAYRLTDAGREYLDETSDGD